MVCFGANGAGQRPTVKDDGSLAYYVWDESSSSNEVKVV